MTGPAPVPTTSQAWAAISDLIEQVAGDATLIADVVTEVRASIREVSGLEAADVARHTRGLLAASTRAIAARRGPTEAELSFVEDLAVTRARQGIPVHAVLAAIHVAERRIWARAKAVAETSGIAASLVLDARELYDDWASAVRERLIVAHRNTEVGEANTRTDGATLRRLLQGGTTAALAAAGAGLGTSVYVVVCPGRPVGFDLVAALGTPRPAVFGEDGPDTGADQIGVLRTPPRLTAAAAPALGWAGPGSAEEVPILRGLAATAARAAAERDRTGLAHVTEVPTVVALRERADLGALLADRYQAALDGLTRPQATIATVRRWLESGRDADRAAAACFVHPNTVRNRVQSVVSATGLDPTDTFEAMDLWWLCTTWLARRE